jgi:hypothetical protein
MDSSRDVSAFYPESLSNGLVTEVQMDLQQAALGEWERNWAPEAREPKCAHFSGLLLFVDLYLVLK